MGVWTNAGGGRAARALHLFLLFVFALAAVEFIFGFVLDASPLKIYLYTPLYNAEFRKSNEKLHTVNITQSNIINDLTEIKDNTTFQDEVSSTQIKNFESIETGMKKNFSVFPLCDSMPPDLGPISVNKTELELDFVETKYPEIQMGGRYTPPNCTARHKIAIIVPYRDRQQHLAIFLNHMHPFLMKQQIEYGIFIIEQEGDKDFNRAKLMNVGFVEGQRLEPDGWQCFIFHDVDLLPLDTRNLYSCPEEPRHMSVAIDKFNFKLPYKHIFGGVSAMTTEQFTKVNGFSNKYWGWGGEDDDMSMNRLKKMNYNISRYDVSIAKYTMLGHTDSKRNPKRFQLLKQTSKILEKDGLTTLEYKIVEVVRHHLFTWILTNIDEGS